MKNNTRNKLKRKIKSVNPAADFKITFKCPIEWDSMEKIPNQERVRFCHDCKLNVYDLLGLSSKEINGLITNNNGQNTSRLF